MNALRRRFPTNGLPNHRRDDPGITTGATQWAAACCFSPAIEGVGSGARHMPTDAYRRCPGRRAAESLLLRSLPSLEQEFDMNHVASRRMPSAALISLSLVAVVGVASATASATSTSATCITVRNQPKEPKGDGGN
jgi:hypothetical protein